MYWKPLRRIFIFILLLGVPLLSSGNIFDDIGECFTDPCNCGQDDDDKYIDETWGYNSDGSRHTFSRREVNPLCPPWDKADERSGCLKQFELPDPFEVYYNKFCAESTEASNYFHPKIRIRMQTCNVACWTHVKSLNWDGECVSYEGPTGLPLTRLCARVTMPANGTPGTVDYRPADPGYSRYEGIRDFDEDGKYKGALKDATYLIMDSEGWYDELESYTDSEGNPFRPKMPKICVYEDFTLGDSIRGKYDPIDADPDRQPMHYNPGVNKIVNVLTTLIDLRGQIKNMLPNLLMKAVSFIPGLDFLSPLLDVLYYYVNYQAELLSWVLKNVGRINNSVADNPLGCVSLPLGPFPPPFPPTLEPIAPALVIDNICPPNINPSRANPCVTSSVSNDYISNAVRVGYDQLVPLCGNSENEDADSSACVTINYADLGNLAMFHGQLENDVIPVCGLPNVTPPCVQNDQEYICDPTYDEDADNTFDCNSGFRVVYGINRGGVIRQQKFYDSSIPECTVNNSATCQVIWGVNIGPFADVAAKFPERQSNVVLGEVSSTVQMHSTPITGSASTLLEKDLKVSVVQQATDVNAYIQEPSEICVYNTTSAMNRLEGCVDRAPPPQVKVYPCTPTSMPFPSGVPPVHCTSTMHDPKLIVSFESEDNKTYGVLGSKHLEQVTSPISLIFETLNLAGTEFRTIVTDKDVTMAPFSGSESLSSSIRFGRYKDGAPYTIYRGEVSVNPDAIYLDGLAYKNGTYYGGGTQICINRVIGHDTCSSAQPQNCVLSRLINAQDTDCEYFNDVVRHNFPGLKRCTVEQYAWDNAPNGFIARDTSKINSKGLQIKTNSDAYCYVYEGEDQLSSGQVNPFPKGEVCSVDLTRSGRIDPSSTIEGKLTADQHYAPANRPAIETIEKYEAVKLAYAAIRPAFEQVQAAIMKQEEADAVQEIVDYMQGNSVNAGDGQTPEQRADAANTRLEQLIHANASSDEIAEARNEKAIAENIVRTISGGNDAESLSAYEQQAVTKQSEATAMLNAAKEDPADSDPLWQLYLKTQIAVQKQQLANGVDSSAVPENAQTEANAAWNIVQQQLNAIDAELNSSYLSYITSIVTSRSVSRVLSSYPQKVARLAQEEAMRVYQNNLHGASAAYNEAYRAQKDAYDAQRGVVDRASLEHATQLLLAADDKVSSGSNFAAEYQRQLLQVNQNNSGFNPKTQGIRNKNIVEQGLCVPIDQPTCNAVANDGINTGFVAWGEAKYGQLSSATDNCPPGMYAQAENPSIGPSSNGLKRYCLYDQLRGTVALAPLANEKGCAHSWSCASEANRGEVNGFAKWSRANVGDYSTATCAPGYNPKSSSAARRLCSLNKTGEAALEPVTDDIGCEYAPRPCYVIPTITDTNTRIWGLTTAFQKRVNGAWANVPFMTIYDTTASGDYRIIIKTPDDVDDPDQGLVNDYYDDGIYNMYVNLNVGDRTTVTNMKLAWVRYKDTYSVHVNGHYIAGANPFPSADDITRTNEGGIASNIFSSTQAILRSENEGNFHKLNLEGNNQLLIKMGVAGIWDRDDNGGIEVILDFTLACDPAPQVTSDQFDAAFDSLQNMGNRFNNMSFSF